MDEERQKMIDESKIIARHLCKDLIIEIQKNGNVSWSRVMDLAKTEMIYKFTLKYFREAGFDIGDYKNPRVKP